MGPTSKFAALKSIASHVDIWIYVDSLGVKNGYCAGGPGTGVGASFNGEPGDEKPVRFDVFPVGNQAAGDVRTVPREQTFELPGCEPFFPFGSVQASPVFGIFVDHDDAAARFHNPADLAHGLFDLDGML